MVNREPAHVCRICLTQSRKTESMFSTSVIPNYRDLIKEFIGLDMVECNDLPHEICEVCSTELFTVVGFVTKCRSSHNKLQEAIENNVSFSEFIELSIKDEDVPLSFLCSQKENVVVSYSKKEIIQDTDIKQEFSDNDDLFDTLDSVVDLDNSVESISNSVRKNDLKKKTVIKTKKNPLECKICGDTLENIDLLKEHKKIHRGEKPYVCPHCGRKFSLKCTLREHVGRVHMRSVHLSKKSCICDLCGKMCFRKYDLKVHMRTHTKEKPYICKLCGLSFSQANTLNQHMRRHTGERPFSCDICEKGFVSRSCLKTHMLVHSDDKNYKCQVCDKGLKSYKGLKQHLLLHSSHKPNVCEVCGAAFAQKVNLKTHIIAKHSERSGTCDICKKDFSNLSEHTRIHTGEKPFKCNICDRGFPRQRHLTTHLRRHREATKYSCPHDKCDAAFPMKCQLDFHVLKFHTKYFPFTCSGCSKGFYRLADLNKHINASNCKKVKQN